MVSVNIVGCKVLIGDLDPKKLNSPSNDVLGGKVEFNVLQFPPVVRTSRIFFNWNHHKAAVYLGNVMPHLCKKIDGLLELSCNDITSMVQVVAWVQLPVSSVPLPRLYGEDVYLVVLFCYDVEEWEVVLDRIEIDDFAELIGYWQVLSYFP